MAHKIVFTMQPGITMQLIKGTLRILNNGAEIFSAEATSGQRGFQGPDDTWKRGQGPIPDVPNLEVETQERVLDSARVDGSTFLIVPQTITNPATGIARGDFGIHRDDEEQGSRGGIVLFTDQDFINFTNEMTAIRQAGISKVPLEIQYLVSEDDFDRTPAKALFTMTLGVSSSLRVGDYTILNSAGQKIYEAAATSGLARFQTFANLWTRNRGPIPNLSNLRVSTRGHLSALVGGFAFFITPETVQNPTGTGAPTRGAFRVHFDTHSPGSQGCIAIRSANDFQRYRDLMDSARTAGVTDFPLELQYT